MPDTILARVTDGRVVTWSGFHTAWKQVLPPARSDSLTPEGARKFLDLLIGKEALAEVALREPWVWTDRESAEYRSLRDGLTMKVVLDSSLAAMRARLGPDKGAQWDDEAVGVAARESAAVAMDVRFDSAMVGRLARSFAAIPRPAPESAMMAQLRVLGTMPAVDPAELPRAVATTREGPYSAGDLLATWQTLSPIYRPRIEGSEQLEDVIKNQLFERELRRAVEKRGVAALPPIARALARKREFYAVSHMVAREVYAYIAMDSVTLHRYYVQNTSDWDLPLRVALARFELPTRQAGLGMVVTLNDAVRAESLMAKGARAGARYGIEVSAQSDSALFARAMRAGTGGVLGPDSTARGWQVVRVLAVEPGRSRTFAECRVLVAQKWYGVEGERLMLDLMARCRRKMPVHINEQAVAKLTSL